MEKRNFSTPRQVKEINVSDIDVFIPRSRDAERHKWLLDSIMDLGLKDPIAVTKDKITHKYRLVYGQGRLEAYKKAGQQSIPALVLDLDESECYENWFTENRMRRSLNPLDQANIMKADRDRGDSLEEIARKYKVSTGYASSMISLMKRASPELKKRLSKAAKFKSAEHKSAITTGKASEITSAFPEHGDQDAIIEAMDDLKVKTTNEIRTVLRKSRQIKTRGKPLTAQSIIKSINRMKADLASVNEWILTRTERVAQLKSIVQSLLRDTDLTRLLQKHKIRVPENL